MQIFRSIRSSRFNVLTSSFPSKTRVRAVASIASAGQSSSPCPVHCSTACWDNELIPEPGAQTALTAWLPYNGEARAGLYNWCRVAQLWGQGSADIWNINLIKCTAPATEGTIWEKFINEYSLNNLPVKRFGCGNPRHHCDSPPVHTDHLHNASVVNGVTDERHY